MTYSNNDSRMKGRLVVPEDRVKLIRQLEARLKDQRKKRRRSAAKLR